jgi:metallo-beta-lactamase family protein
MKLTFWGAARQVTGSLHVVETVSGKKILLDCGLYQGPKHGFDEPNSEWPCPPSEVDFVILSHAHIDHCGLLPKLVAAGYDGPIFSTPATRDLATIMLLDSAHIQEKDAEYENIRREKQGKPKVQPLYTTADVVPCLNSFVTVGYEKWFEISREISFVFKDAGHLLGSATVTLKIQENGKEIMLGFTGDVGRPDRPILKDPVPMPPLDYLICESTYGSRVHEMGPEAEDKLLEIVKETCVRNKGKLIIPAFSVGRTQVIIYSLDRLSHSGLLPQIPVYVDSPLAVNATDIFRMHPECFDAELMQYLLKDSDPFGFSQLHYVRDVNESKALNLREGPCIIISASGMIEAGRIKHHIRNNISNSRNTILIVGYCTPNTIGGKLRAGAETIMLFGEEYPVRAKVIILDAYSAHGDQKEIFDVLQNQTPGKMKKVFLVHGEENDMEVFRDAWLQKGFKEIVLPRRKESFILA